MSLPIAILFCIITMLDWGSWANTQKLAGQGKMALRALLLGLRHRHVSLLARIRNPRRNIRRGSSRHSGVDQRRYLQSCEYLTGGLHRCRRNVRRVSCRHRTGASHRHSRKLGGNAERQSIASVCRRRLDCLRHDHVRRITPNGWKESGSRADFLDHRRLHHGPFLSAVDAPSDLTS